MIEDYKVLLENDESIISHSIEEDHIFIQTDVSQYRLYHHGFRPVIDCWRLDEDLNDGSYRHTGPLQFKDVADVYRWFCIDPVSGEKAQHRPAPKYDKWSKLYEGEDGFREW